MKLKAIVPAFLLSAALLLSSCRSEAPVCGGFPEIKSNRETSETHDEYLTIVMAGDLLMHKLVRESGLKNDGGYDYTHLFARVKSITASADIAIINQETLLAGKKYGYSGYPCFNSPLEVADAVADAGFDVILQATNHALDKGLCALECCRDYWIKNYPQIALAGTHTRVSDADNICVVEKNGIRIAVLNFSYGTNGIPLPQDAPWAVELLEEENVRRDFEKARSESDFIIVCPHWGNEYSHTPSSEQRAWCSLFAECGADLIIGTHPHVIQPLEYVTDSTGKKQIPVYWSLGNFVNSSAVSGKGASARMLGGMANVVLKRDESGKITIKDAGVIPLVTQLSEGFAGVCVYPFSEYTEALALSNTIVRRHDPLFSYEYCTDTFKKIFGDCY